MKHILAIALAIAALPASAQTVEYMFTKKTTDGSSVSFGLQPVTSSNGMFTVSGGSLVITPTSTFAAAAHNQAWSTITSTPTTLSGYGITDALQAGFNVSNLGQSGATNNQVLKWNGSAWVPATMSASSVAWADVTGKPTTVSGYGITDALQAGFSVGSIGQSGATGDQILKWNGTAWVAALNEPYYANLLDKPTIGTFGAALMALDAETDAISFGNLTHLDQFKLSGSAIPNPEGGPEEPYTITVSVKDDEIPLASFGNKEIKYPFEDGVLLTNNSAFNGGNLVNGTVTLAKIGQSSAVVGQVPVWNSGGYWAAATLSLPTRKVLSADTTTSSTSLSSIAGLQQTLTSGVSYDFDVVINYTTAANTTGLGLSVTTDSGTATIFWADIEIWNGTTGAIRSETINALDTAVTNSSGPPASTPFFARIKGHIVADTNTTLRIRFKSEINASDVTVKAGSRCYITGY